MRHPFARRRARFTMLFVGAVVASAVAAAPALAASSTIAAAVATATPEQAVPIDVTISGTNNSGAAAYLDVLVRPAGGLGCQASYSDDEQAVGAVNTTLVFPGTESIASGSYQQTVSYRPPEPASYQLCAWLDPSPSGNSPVAGGGPAQASFTARAPQVSQLHVAVSQPLSPNTAFSVSYVTQTDQQLTLYSAMIIAPHGTQCPSSYEAAAQRPLHLTSLLGVTGRSVFGGPVTNTATTVQPRGAYLICTWVEGPDRGEVDGSASTPVTIGSAAASPNLKLTKVTASRHRGISLAGTTAAALSGRLSVTAACGAGSRTATPSASGGRFSAHLRAPKGCAAGKRVKVTVTWHGTAAFSRGQASRTVTLKH